MKKSAWDGQTIWSTTISQPFHTQSCVMYYLHVKNQVGLIECKYQNTKSMHHLYYIIHTTIVKAQRETTYKQMSNHPEML